MSRFFVGRHDERAGLKGLLKKKSASLVVIRGRRRIGKSRLAEEFASCFTRSYVMSGLPPEGKVTAQNQRDEFSRQMRDQGIDVNNTRDWGDLLTSVAKHCSKGRVLIVLDEITWMGDQDPTFLPKLKTVWDLHFKKNPELILLISGSNSMWIEKNILSSTGFVGRISYRLHLKELPLHYCNEFWPGKVSLISPFEKFKVLSVTGGVPRYLEEIRSDLTAEQNIFSLCYKPSGILFSEFDEIFSDLFANRNAIYKKITQLLVDGQLTMKDLLGKLKRPKNGDISKYLDELVEAGFLARMPSWSILKEKEERLGYYRISDNYTRFYLKYIEPYRERIASNKLRTIPRGWKSILGLQFENLVCNNAHTLYDAIGLSDDEIVWSGPYFQAATTRQKGCQIDYLIQSKYRVLYVCEVKFSEREIPYKVVKEAESKSQRLKIPKGFSLRHVLVHVNGVAEKIEYSEAFSNVIDFSLFLNRPNG